MQQIYKLSTKFAFAIFFIFASILANNTIAQEGRNAAEYNMQNGVGLKGYDPVSYFPEGGQQPTLGKPEIIREHQGIIYFFTSEMNANTFLKNPEKYEPTYGGWCAYAMASGTKVDIQPTIYTLHGNRLHFFVSKRAKQKFDSNLIEYETRADQFWKQISGEEPRNQ